MSRRLEEERDELIQKVQSHIKQKLPPSEAEILSIFSKQYYLSASPTDLLERNMVDLYGAMVAHWHFIAKREPQEAKVHVYNPQYEQHGWQSTHMVIEIISDFKPFLIESIRMVLNRQGLNIHLILNSGKIQVERDAGGNILALQPVEQISENGHSEISMFIEIDRQSDPKVLEDLKTALEITVIDVTSMVNDWHAMTDKMNAVISELQGRLTQSGKPDLDEEIIEFLKWINDNHFTYLGYCKRKLEINLNHYEWSLDANSCLGILRNQGATYLSRFKK